MASLPKYRVVENSMKQRSPDHDESEIQANAHRALSALQRELPERVFVDPKSCFAASLDNLRLSFLPCAVVKVHRPRRWGLCCAWRTSIAFQ